jgi:iron complex outermembrane receptor protein
MIATNAGSAAKIYRRICHGALMACLLLPSMVGATDTNSPPDVGDLSLEQLINIKVTSVSKKETRLESAPAAITVITQDDIRRLGIESIPEALRLVPGMDVSQVNSHEWAVSARGFNDQFANKLLVLIDGRAVYTPAFGGVYWDVQDLPMEDIDRIEVIRGPGATLWGENAVNGVVNIITKNAKDTQGILASVSGGTWDQPSVTIQYGGQLATNLYYRTYIKYFNRDSFVVPDGNNAPDAWQSARGGTRLDWNPQPEDELTLQGDGYYNQLGENVDVPVSTSPFWQSNNITDHDAGGNILGRWTHTISDTSQFSVQTYDDYFSEQEAQATERQNTFDLEVQHRFSLLERNDIVWGLDYRNLYLNTPNGAYITYNSAVQSDNLYSGFVQDEITVLPDILHLTAGTKLEYDKYGRFQYEPSIRVAWTPTDKQTVWAAISRAVRTPAIYNLNGTVNETFVPSGPNPFGEPEIFSVEANSGLKSEDLIAYEAGYRVQPFETLSLDAAAFYDSYDNLVTYNPPSTFVFGPGQVVFPITTANGGSGNTYGGEISAQWKPLNNWRLIASYSLFKNNGGSAGNLLANDPQQQAQLRSYLDITPTLEFNGMISYVDRIDFANINQMVTIPSYERLDLGIIWRPTKSLELGIWGQNLLQARHAEFVSDTTTQLIDVPRIIMAKITVRF